MKLPAWHFCSHGTVDVREKLMAASESIDSVKPDARLYVIHDRGRWVSASIWHHWAMPEPIWWSNALGQVNPTRILDAATMIEVA